MFTKNNVSALEVELQEIASNYGFTPRIHSVKKDVVVMDKVNGICLADQYTDDPKKIPKHIWQEIHRILSILYEREGIEYIDITSYNFMEDSEGKIWIIDFGHAYYTDPSKKVNWFLKEFLDGEFGWNPDFA
jgi:RIO-like serine/threonine protein kinase